MTASSSPVPARGVLLDERGQTAPAPESFVDVSRRPASRVPGRRRRTEVRGSTSVSAALAQLAGSSNRWRSGVHGDEGLADRLARLEVHGWWMLHELALPEGIVDHLLVGPAGVHAVYVRTHSRSKVVAAETGLRINGKPADYVDGLHEITAAAARRLSAAVGFDIDVATVLVVLTETVVPEVHVARQPEDFSVLDRTNCARWFQRLPAIHSARAVAVVYDIARRSTTWSEPAPSDLAG